MKLIEAHSWFKIELKGIYTPREIDYYFKNIMSHLAYIDRICLALEPDRELNYYQSHIFKHTAKQLKGYMPFQYVLGVCDFMDRTFLVNQNVLIPRPETQDLIQWIYTDYHSHKGLRIIDIGTGCGCIAISLALNDSTWTIQACDKFQKVLDNASINAQVFGAEVDFFLLDIIKSYKFKVQTPLDIIVSNPPYIPDNQQKDILPNVLNWEPHSSLFVPKDHPLIFIKKIAVFGKINLKPYGSLYFEINPDFWDQIEQLLVDLGYIDVAFKEDRHGRVRMAKAINHKQH